MTPASARVRSRRVGGARPGLAGLACLLLLGGGACSRDPAADETATSPSLRDETALEPFPIDSADAPCPGIVATRLPRHDAELEEPEYICYPPGSLDRRYLPAPPADRYLPPKARWPR